MTLWKFMVAALVALSLGSTATAAAPATNELQLLNTIPRIDAFVARTQGMTGAERLAAFDREIRPLAGGFYAKTPAPRLLNHLAMYPFRRAKIMEVSNRFDAMFADARSGFEQAFGPLDADQPIYLVHSFGEMDGGTRQLPGGMTLLFGADVIAKVHDASDTRPFFHHELFHLMHLPRFWEHGCEGNWCMVWGEGLATYVAVKLNPDVAVDKSSMIDPALRDAVERDRAAAFCAARDAMAGSDDEARSSLLTTQKTLGNYPGRLGYYLGYLVVSDLGETRSLAQLAALSPSEVKPLFDAAVSHYAGACRH